MTGGKDDETSPKPTDAPTSAVDADAAAEVDAADDADAVDSAKDQAVRRLLRRAMPEPVREPSPEFLRGVQARIRSRSRGKFFADGWSTSNRRVSYGSIAVAMLLLLLLAFVLLTPRTFVGP